MIFCLVRPGTCWVREVIISWVGFTKHLFPHGISVQTYHLQTMSIYNRVNIYVHLNTAIF